MIETITALLSKVFDKLPVADWLGGKRRARQDHDRSKFRELEERILPEAVIEAFLDEAANEGMSRARAVQVDGYLEWIRRTGNGFLIRKLQNARRDFDKELRDLREYLMVHVFAVSGQDEFLEFRPDQRHHRPGSDERNYYDARVAELDGKVAACSTAYRAFRQMVKFVLFV
jgi:hypothetical protein